MIITDDDDDDDNGNDNDNDNNNYNGKVEIVLLIPTFECLGWVEKEKCEFSLNQ